MTNDIVAQPVGRLPIVIANVTDYYDRKASNEDCNSTNRSSTNHTGNTSRHASGLHITTKFKALMAPSFSNPALCGDFFV